MLVAERPGFDVLADDLGANSVARRKVQATR